MVLTETKAKSVRVNRSWLQLLRKKYTVFQSLVPSSEHSKAGVLVAVAKPLTELGTIRQEFPPQGVQGYLLHVVIETPESNPLHIAGAYCPPQSKDQGLRKTIYTECEKILAGTPATHCTTIVAGDFNATIQNADRYGTIDRCEAMDSIHRQFLTRAKLLFGVSKL